jgi:hypothetical protein
MARTVFLVSGLLCAGIGLASLVSNVLADDPPICDNEIPKTATMACSSGIICDNQDNSKQCAAASSGALEINQDFPSGCKEWEGYICQKPLEQCKRTVDCEWLITCQPKPGTEGAWQSEPKWTELECP